MKAFSDMGLECFEPEGAFYAFPMISEFGMTSEEFATRFLQEKKVLINAIATDPGSGDYAVDFLMIAKYFERIGDHATNIAEWVIFSVTGVHEGGD